jgi:hypothetical protein
MYNRLPSALSELIANAWDAEASQVKIDSNGEQKAGQDYREIVVVDDGLGMSFEEIQQQYLKIGRNRRKATKKDHSPNLKRKVMGRKGLGKLAGFGIANVVQVRTCKNEHVTEFKMDFNKMTSIRDEDGNSKDYEPEVILNEHIAGEKQGTRVTLKKIRLSKLYWKNAKEEIARRFLTFKDGMEVSLRGEPITSDFYDIESRCENIWRVNNSDSNFSLGDGAIEIQIGENKKNVRVKGWIGAMEKPVPGDIGNGIAVYAKKKLVQEPTFTGIVPQGAMTVSFSYMLGNIEADFIDEENDRVNTGRNSIVWASDEGQALQAWLTRAIKKVSSHWYKLREDKNLKKVLGEQTTLDDYVSHLGSKREREQAKKIIKQITKHSQDKELATELANYVVESSEYRAFVDVVDSFGDMPVIPIDKVLGLMKDWELIEGREILRLLTGRVYAIKILIEMLGNNVKERELHGFLEKHPWIIDPQLTVAHSEIAYTTLLRRDFPDTTEAGGTKRFDLVCLTLAGEYVVVEFKKSDVYIGFKELAQVEQYVKKVRDLAKGAKQNKNVRGLLIYNKLKSEIDDEILKGRASINCFSYKQLINSAMKLHADFIQRLETMAEYRPILDKISPIYKKLQGNIVMKAED